MNSREKQIAMQTSRGAGASVFNADGSIRAIVPRYVENNVEKCKKILDFGAGKCAVATKYLRQKGFNVTAYDFWADIGDEVLDSAALDHKYDVVFASNVINVQSSEEALYETLVDIYHALKDGGEFVCNYPSSPRKLGYTVKEMHDVIAATFGNTPERVGGTPSYPIWKVKA